MTLKDYIIKQIAQLVPRYPDFIFTYTKATSKKPKVSNYCAEKNDE